MKNRIINYLNNKITLLIVILITVFGLLIYKKEHRLTMTKRLEIKIDSYSKLPNTFNYSKIENKEYIYFVNGRGLDNELVLIDLDDNKIEKISIDILKDKTDPVRIVNISKDEIIISNSPSNCFSREKYYQNLYVLDRNGKQIQKYDMLEYYKDLNRKIGFILSPSFLEYNYDKGTIITVLNNQNLYKYEKNDSIINMKGLHSSDRHKYNEFSKEFNETKINFPILTRVENVLSGDLKVSYGLYNFLNRFTDTKDTVDYYFKSLNYGSLNMTQDNNGYMYMVHRNNDSIYKVNSENFEIENVYPFNTKFGKIKTKISPKEILNNFYSDKIDIFNRVSHISSISPYIHNIIYDKYRKQFYIIVYGYSKDKMNSSDVYGERDWALVIYDKKLQYVREYIYSGKEYHPIVFISKKGILLPLNQDNDEEEYNGKIYLDLYQFN